MIINKIKNKVIENVGIRHKFKFNGSRNQIEEFEGIINNTYNAVFTILVDEFSIKSFSYSDILTKNLEILDVDFSVF